MKKINAILITLAISISFIFTGCGSTSQQELEKPTTVPETTVNEPKTTTHTTTTAVQQQNIDYATVKPNENGKVVVMMLHAFAESFTPTKGNPGDYITTFDAFRETLQTLYDKGFRLISMTDYLSNNISVPAGYKPIVFTFDDGTEGQFNLVEENGKLIANKESAVGIMQEFNKQHPDFGLKGTFYVNLNNENTFKGKGTLAERLKYLIDNGFEIGNHTLDHAVLGRVKTADKIVEQVGGNQKKMDELVPGNKMTTHALPEGSYNKTLKDYIIKGNYEGTEYENKAIMLVGAEPAFSPVSKSFNPLLTARIRSTGIHKVECDFDWWLQRFDTAGLYVSDGNPETVAVPKDKENNVDTAKLNGKKLITY